MTSISSILSYPKNFFLKKWLAYACTQGLWHVILEERFNKENYHERFVFSLVAVSAVAFTAVCLPLATPTSATSCDDVQFIYARGSGQDLGAGEYQELKNNLEEGLSFTGSKLKYSFYELGTSPHGGEQYKAVGLDLFSTIGAKISNGEAYEFGASVESGITELTSYLKEVSTSCPSTKFVLSGYSQGAMVLTKAVPELDPDKILYVATFGDPKLYLPEGEGLEPDACKGINLSPYRVYAPNCRTSAGSLGAKVPYQEVGWEGKIGIWCRDKDLICGAGIKITSKDGNINPVDNAISSHTSYVSGGQIDSIAKTIIKKLPETFPDKLSSFAIETANSTGINTVVMLDHSYHVAPYKERNVESAKELAREIYVAGGKTALYSYTDYVDKKPVTGIIDLWRHTEIGFGCNLATIHYNGETTAFTKEISLLSAIKTALKEQPWQAGAAKSIVIFTNRGYRDPDYDGTTLDKIISLSLAIDPVNIYIVVPENMPEDQQRELQEVFAPLTEGTNGGFYTTSQISTLGNLLSSRPSVNFPLTEYSGKPGETFTFSTEVSQNAVKYEWDLDFDGTFETVTPSPSVTKTYLESTSGYIQLKVTDGVGNTSTGSAKVSVSNTAPQYLYLNYDIDDDGFVPTLNSVKSVTTLENVIAIPTPSENSNDSSLTVPNCGKL